MNVHSGVDQLEVFWDIVDHVTYSNVLLLVDYLKLMKRKATPIDVFQAAIAQAAFKYRKKGYVMTCKNQR